MYCKKCNKIARHSVFAQEPYDLKYRKREIQPNKPILCRCECDYQDVYATHEFKELQEEPFAGMFKIFGLSYLEAGDDVYYPETNEVYSVRGIMHSKKRMDSSEMIYTVTLEGNDKKTMELQLEAMPSKENIGYYRLLPQDMPKAKIGDLVYSIDRKDTGVAVGLSFKDMSSVVVKFKDSEELVEIKDKNTNYWQDSSIIKNMQWRLEKVPFSHDVLIDCNEKVLIVQGSMRNIKEIERVISIAEKTPQVRCVVSLLEMKIKDFSATDIIENVYKKLLQNNIFPSNCKMDCFNQNLTINGFYSDKNLPQKIKTTLGNLPIKELKLNLNFRENIKIFKILSDSDKYVRITRVDDEVYMDGFVTNKEQIRKSRIFASILSLKLKINNCLKVFEINDSME